MNDDCNDVPMDPDAEQILQVGEEIHLQNQCHKEAPIVYVVLKPLDVNATMRELGLSSDGDIMPGKSLEVLFAHLVATGYVERKFLFN